MFDRFLRFLLIVLLLAASVRLAPAATPPPAAGAAVALAEIPDHTGLVVDRTGRLDGAVMASLSARLAAIQASGRAQVAILLSPGSGDEALAAYALRVAESWQLGRSGRDDGLLVVVVPASNTARIEVGYGLEGVVTDALASRWLDELIPALKAGDLAGGLGVLVDSIDAALPAVNEEKPAGEVATESNYVFPDHPEWRLPFVLVLFSLFSIMPLFVGRWGALASAPMLAGFYGMAAWSLWDSPTAGYVAAALAFPLPLLWSLNGGDAGKLPPLLRRALAMANAIGIAAFFAILTLFVGVALDAGGVPQLWVAPLFAGALAVGLVPFLFPGRPAQLALVFLRSYMHFLFALIIFWFGLSPFASDPTPLAFALAATFTGCIAASLWLDSRGPSRASPWLIGLALLLFLPFAALVLLGSIVQEDPATLLAQLAAGGGSLGGVLWWAARHGFFAALKIGLGGRFGGGGAGRDG